MSKLPVIYHMYACTGSWKLPVALISTVKVDTCHTRPSSSGLCQEIVKINFPLSTSRTVLSHVCQVYGHPILGFLQWVTTTEQFDLSSLLAGTELGLEQGSLLGSFPSWDVLQAYHLVLVININLFVAWWFLPLTCLTVSLSFLNPYTKLCLKWVVPAQDCH